MTRKKNTDLVRDIVAKNLCYCSKTNLAGDITGDLAGEKKLYYCSKTDFVKDVTRDIVAIIFCYCSKTSD
jgi:hypothetical protein